MGKKNEPLVYDEVPGNFEIGKGVRLAEGSRVCLIGTGNIIHEVVAAGRRLNGEGCFTEYRWWIKVQFPEDGVPNFAPNSICARNRGRD